MYGLSYCGLGYERLMEMDIDILGILIKAEIDREIHEYDISMQRLAWQTAYLMNSTGNYKSAVKPDKLYTPLAEQLKKKKPDKDYKKDVQAQREELKKTFGL